jgi:hypothetical protein
VAINTITSLPPELMLPRRQILLRTMTSPLQSVAPQLLLLLAPAAVVAEAEIDPESVVVVVSEAVETIDAPAPAATTGVAESPVEAEESATSAGEMAAAGDANESVGEDAAVAETEGV